MAEIREMNKTTAKINENKGWFWEDKQNWQTFSQTYQQASLALG